MVGNGELFKIWGQKDVAKFITSIGPALQEKPSEQAK